MAFLQIDYKSEALMRGVNIKVILPSDGMAVSGSHLIKHCIYYRVTAQRRQNLLLIWDLEDNPS